MMKAKHKLSFAKDKDPYLMVVAWEVIKLAFEQLMRLAELVTTKLALVSMRNPLKWCDVAYEDVQVDVLGYDGRGRPLGVPVIARLREPPSMISVIEGNARCWRSLLCGCGGLKNEEQTLGDGLPLGKMV